jgi:hypothetical protein
VVLKFPQRRGLRGAAHAKPLAQNPMSNAPWFLLVDMSTHKDAQGGTAGPDLISLVGLPFKVASGSLG